MHSSPQFHCRHTATEQHVLAVRHAPMTPRGSPPPGRLSPRPPSSLSSVSPRCRPRQPHAAVASRPHHAIPITAAPARRRLLICGAPHTRRAARQPASLDPP